MPVSHRTQKNLEESLNMAKNTKKNILQTGVEMWLENPMSVNAHAIARRMGMTHGAILYHFPISVRDAVADHAVENGNCAIICQLIASGHKAVNELTAELRDEYLANF